MEGDDATLTYIISKSDYWRMIPYQRGDGGGPKPIGGVRLVNATEVSTTVQGVDSASLVFAIPTGETVTLVTAVAGGKEAVECIPQANEMLKAVDNKQVCASKTPCDLVESVLA